MSFLEIVGIVASTYLIVGLILSAFSIKYAFHNFKGKIGFIRFLNFVVSQPLIWLEEIIEGLKKP
ncbi:hypothetical protein [Helicobacter labetoulli]|uniref:hypothetical protein n=1 Tax=Helicobacter labetoulli TaxID=2315333 RepID=UPI000EF72640|nr:hypothetical protein [Helicobacter labetoulli]